MITRLVFLLTATLVCAEARPWRSAEGGRAVEGEFIKLAADQLHLEAAARPAGRDRAEPALL